MPGKKQRKKGSGRPKSAPENLTYSTMSTPEKKEYHNTARDKTENRNQASSSQASNEAATPEMPSSGPGRPPIGDISMSPGTHQKRSTERRSCKRKAEKLSQIRRAAVNKRWDPREATENVVELSESDLAVPFIDNDPENEPESAPMSCSTVFCRKARLRGKLPSNIIQHLDVFMATLHKLDRPDLLPPLEFDYSSSLSKYQRLYRAKLIAEEVFHSSSTEVQDEIMRYWLDIILSYDVLEHILSDIGFIIPDHLLPKKINVARIADRLRGLFISRNRTSQEQRVLGNISL